MWCRPTASTYYVQTLQGRACFTADPEKSDHGNGKESCAYFLGCVGGVCARMAAEPE